MSLRKSSLQDTDGVRDIDTEEGNEVSAARRRLRMKFQPKKPERKSYSFWFFECIQEPLLIIPLVKALGKDSRAR